MKGRQIVTYLSSLPFFAEVSRESLDQLCAGLEPENYDNTETIFLKGEEGDAMFVILEGRVKVHDNGHVYDYLKKGECFGEYSMIDNQTRSASITAADDTSVLRIKRDHFLELMSRDAGFAQGILTVMIKRHRDLDVIQGRLAASKHDLELANSKMTGLINGAMDSIIMFDDKFRITLANPSAQRLLQNKDVLQRNLLLFLDEESSDFLQEVVSRNPSEKNTYSSIFIQAFKANRLGRQANCE